jgi:hypothetical protein
MERRDVLRPALSAATATGMLGATGSAAFDTPSQHERLSGSGSYIRTRDGESLF